MGKILLKERLHLKTKRFDPSNSKKNSKLGRYSNKMIDRNSKHLDGMKNQTYFRLTLTSVFCLGGPASGCFKASGGKTSRPPSFVASAFHISTPLHRYEMISANDSYDVDLSNVSDRIIRQREGSLVCITQMTNPYPIKQILQ